MCVSVCQQKGGFLFYRLYILYTYTYTFLCVYSTSYKNTQTYVSIPTALARKCQERTKGVDILAFHLKVAIYSTIHTVYMYI